MLAGPTQCFTIDTNTHNQTPMCRQRTQSLCGDILTGNSRLFQLLNPSSCLSFLLFLNVMNDDEEEEEGKLLTKSAGYFHESPYSPYTLPNLDKLQTLQIQKSRKGADCEKSLNPNCREEKIKSCISY